MEEIKRPRDLYAEVTRRIVESIDKGVRPWSCPWTRQEAVGGALPRRHTGEAYRGVNVLLLWASAVERGYRSQTWLTYQQAATMGGQVRRGERGTTVVYAGQFTPAGESTELDDDDAQTHYRRNFLRSYTVFNVEQIDGLALPATLELGESPKLDATAQGFVDRIGANVRHCGDRAFYSPGSDLVQVPQPGQFRDLAAYFGTLTHELVHWTGHPSRLARQFGQRFGDHSYAMEELVAELGAAFLCAEFNVSNQPRDDHAAYLAEWLAVLRTDKRALFTAAAQAQRAVDFLHESQVTSLAEVA